MATATDTLLAEQEALLEELGAVRGESITEELVVIDPNGKDTGMRVQRVTPSERRAQQQREIQRIEAELAFIDAELRNRGY